MKPGYIVGGFVIVFCIAVTAMALSGSVRRTVTFAEARQSQQPCEIYGAVVKDSVTPDMGTGHFAFQLQEVDAEGTPIPGGATMRVLSLKSKAANFDQATHVKAIGMMAGGGMALGGAAADLANPSGSAGMGGGSLSGGGNAGAAMGSALSILPVDRLCSALRAYAVSVRSPAMREALIRKLLSLTVELLIRFRRYLQMFTEERRDLPRVDCLPRHLGGGVVPAW